MAIKIIKQGKITKFTKTCPDCGCEFEYEEEDLKVDTSMCLTTYPCQFSTYVICPCCGKHLHHGYISTTGYISTNISSYPNITYTVTKTGVKDLDCDNCPNRPDPENPVAGDSPCDWCIKNHLHINKI